MSDIEFLEPDHDDWPEPDQDATATDAEQPRSAAPRIADTVLTVVGVVLLVVACFRTSYSISLGSRFSLRDLSVDGWGRLQDTAVGSRGQHATRFGIVSCIAAGVALVALAVRLAVARRSWADRVGAGLGWTAAGAAAATVGGAVLSGLSTLDSYRAALQTETLDPSTNGLPRRPIEIAFGAYVWLSVAGVVCLAVALLWPTLTRWRPRRRQPDGLWDEQPQPIADDELR